MLRSVHGDFIVSSLQQILHTIEPNMQASGSVEQTEELLLRLEEIDENFHKFVDICSDIFVIDE